MVSPAPVCSHRTRCHCRCGWWTVQDRLWVSGPVGPAPACLHRTRSHYRCGWRPVQDSLRLAGPVNPTPACPHRTRPPPQLRLEHAEGAGPGRRTAQTGPCGPAQHSVTLKPQLAPSARPARARQTGQTGPWGPPLHLVTLKPQLEASAGPARACQTGRPSPCVPHRTRFHCRCGCRPLQDRLGLAGPVGPAPACPNRTRSHCSRGWRPTQDRLGPSGPVGPALAGPEKNQSHGSRSWRSLPGRLVYSYTVYLAPTDSHTPRRQLDVSAGAARKRRNGLPGPGRLPPARSLRGGG